MPLADGTFELAGAISQWAASGGTTALSTAQAHSPVHSALVTVSGTPSQVTLRPGGPYQAPAIPGWTATASLWVFPGSSGMTFHAAIDWFDASGAYLSTSSGPSSAPAAGTWTQFTVTAVAPAGAASAFYGPTLNPVSGTSFFTDDVTFAAQPPVPAVPQVPAGWRPDQADVDLWVTSSFSFLAKPAVFRAQLNGTQALTGSAFTLIPLDTVLEDPYSGWSATATASQPAHSWLCPAGAGGWYEATLTVFTGAQPSGLAATALYLNGANWAQATGDWAVTTGDSGSDGTVQVPLSPGDYVQFYGYATNSVSTPSGGPSPAFELAWVSS